METMRKSNDEIYQLAKDQALVKKLKNNKRFLFFFSLILFPTWIVVNDINFGSIKVIQ
jgi:hypothetical protein